MAITPAGSWATGVAVTNTTAATFIPELWSDEIIAAYKANLVMPQLVTVMNHTGKKGDTIHIPKPTRGSASAKASEAQVTLIAATEGEEVYTIDQHFEYSRLIEDITAVQAKDSLRRFYTDDAGYALAVNLDTALHTQAADFRRTTSAYDGFVIGGDGVTAWDPTANTNAGNGTALSDDGVRAMLQDLDDSDVPSMGRAFVIPPVTANTLRGLARFTEQAFVGEVAGGNTIRNGIVGDLYGVPVYVSTQCATVTADDTTTDYRACLLLQKEAELLIEQMGPRSQRQYKQEYLADLFTSDVLYGTGILRDEGALGFIVPV